MACRQWCFTLNGEEAPTLEIGDLVAFYIYQKEKAPTTGQIHYQGYIQLKKSQRLSGMKKLIPRAHWEKARGSPEDNIRYCSKEESRAVQEEGPITQGVWVKPGSNKRKIMDQYKEDPEEMRLTDPAQYKRCKFAEAHVAFIEEFKFNHTLKDWQVQLEDKLAQGPDDRTIIWIYGPDGNDGKTTYAKKLYQEGWFYSTGGAHKDIMYNYAGNPEAHVVFDIPRCKEEFIQYSTIESMKNRIIQSDKYEPVSGMYAKPIHVVVMANFFPDRTKLSEDRLCIIDTD